MNTVHRLLRHRLVARLEHDEHQQPVAVIIPLACGDCVRIETAADASRLIKTLVACRDGLKHAEVLGRKRG